jgi:hypothetical protein
MTRRFARCPKADPSPEWLSAARYPPLQCFDPAAGALSDRGSIARRRDLTRPRRKWEHDSLVTDSKRVAALARVLLVHSPTLLLDALTVGLDHPTASRLLNDLLAAASGKTSQHHSLARRGHRVDAVIEL